MPTLLTPFRKRALVLALATVLLHAFALRWAGRQFGAEGGAPEPGRVLVAQLRPAAPPAAPATPPVKRAAPKPKPKPAPAAVQGAPAALAAIERGAAADAAAADAAAADAAAADAAPAEAAAAEAAAAEAGPSEQAMDEAPVDEAPAESSAASSGEPEAAAAPDHPIRVDLPPPAHLVLQVMRTDPRTDNPTYGSGRVVWELDGNRYRLSVDAEFDLLITKLNLLKLTSEGRLGAQGLEPATYTESRRGRSTTATHFNRDEGRVTFSSSTAQAPLTPGAQDRASLMMQLAGIGRAGVAQVEGPDGFPLQVGEAGKATVYRFFSHGFEEIETRMGRMRAWHVSRPPVAGSYSSRMDLWFAPDLNWYPVQIRNTEANGAVTTQSVTKILVAGNAPR